MNNAELMRQMQARMQKMQDDLAKESVEGSAGGGAVKVVVNGQQKLLSIAIEPDAAEDVEMLQDLVVAAVNDCMDRSRELAAERMQSVAAGLGLPPGLL